MSHSVARSRIGVRNDQYTPHAESLGGGADTTVGSMNDRPIILIIADALLAAIEQEFRSRYDRDYLIELADSPAAGLARLRAAVDADHAVALIVTDVEVAGQPGWELLREAQGICATARRVTVVSPGPPFRHFLEPLRQAVLRRDIDTFIAIPLGPRDEEFHTAMAELLSDWGWTASRPSTSYLDIVAEPGDREASAIKDLLDRLGFPSRTLTPYSIEGAAILAEMDEPVLFPVMRVFYDHVMSGATASRVNEFITARADEIPHDAVADLLVIGAGPAGLAAAVYAASEGLSTAVLERDAIGGQAGTSSMIRNYLGFPRGISGMRLAQRSRVQAGRFGAVFYAGRSATSIDACMADGVPSYRVSMGDSEMTARAVLLATGVSYRRLGVAAVDEFVGAGVFYGAATSAAREMVGGNVIVVGGGNSAGQAAVHLAKFARSVTVLIRRDSLSATMSDYLIREIDATPNIVVRGNSYVTDGGGGVRLEWVTLSSTTSAESERVAVDGAPRMPGAEPDSARHPAGMAPPGAGYILTGRDVPKETWVDAMPPADLETTLPGVFAAGDVRARSMKRVASASGEGASVMPLVHTHLEALRAQEFAQRLESDV